jgi:uncharacterized membrane protein YeiH
VAASLLALDIAGSFVFALSGALAAVRAVGGRSAAGRMR